MNEKEPMKYIGENIKTIRKNKKITQKEISSLLNVNIRTFQKYESGEINIPLDTLKRIANILQVSIYDLFGEELTDSRSIRLFHAASNAAQIINGRKHTSEEVEERLKYYLLRDLLDSINCDIYLLTENEKNELLDKIKEFTQFEVYKLEKLKGISLLKRR